MSPVVQRLNNPSTHVPATPPRRAAFHHTDKTDALRVIYNRVAQIFYNYLLPRKDTPRCRKRPHDGPAQAEGQ
jgi:hypothetical protein